MKAQKKHMKRNNQSKYVKKQNMKQAGITLIALVVTIIVLLILAGVTIGMATSNTGIFKRASNAADTWNESRGKENAALASWEDAIDKHAGAGTGTNPSTPSEPVSSITIGTDTITKTNAKDYFGREVTGYSTDGTWRLFFIDFDNKYGDGAGTIYLKRDWSANDTNPYAIVTSTSTKYTPSEGAYATMQRMNKAWSEGAISTSDQTTKRGTLSYDLLNINEKQAVWLCDPNVSNWSKYKTDKANYVIGSPSAEMYCDSYNLTHGENALTVEYKIDKSAPGYIYKVKGAEQNNGYWTNNDTVDYTGYHSMYCGKDENKGDYWWWLASPSAYDSNLCLQCERQRR